MLRPSIRECSVFAELLLVELAEAQGGKGGLVGVENGV